ncbi:MAG: DoxX family protein [Thermoproteota archaeon]|nr:DoxX family protein [Thermoproteota archaeon]
MNSLQFMKFGPLPIRILAGLALILHGLPKITDISGTQSFFPNIGLPPELAIPVAVLEVIGGLAILFGILTRIAAGLFIIEMIGATVVAKLSKGFVGGFELELLIMAICISLFITGPGRISIEYDVLKRELFPRGKRMVDHLREKSALS